MINIHLNDQLLGAFLFHVSILVAKTLAMDFFAQLQILKSKKIESKSKHKDAQVTAQISEKIERIKRAHYNDIENIPIFIAVAFVYLCTDPELETALLLFRTFTIARIAHTFVYAIWVVPQPARGIAFITGEIITWYMIVKGVMFACT